MALVKGHRQVFFFDETGGVFSPYWNFINIYKKGVQILTNFL
jgi:hypothetical protein